MDFDGKVQYLEDIVWNYLLHSSQVKPGNVHYKVLGYAHLVNHPQMFLEQLNHLISVPKQTAGFLINNGKTLLKNCHSFIQSKRLSLNPGLPHERECALLLIQWWVVSFKELQQRKDHTKHTNLS